MGDVDIGIDTAAIDAKQELEEEEEGDLEEEKAES